MIEDYENYYSLEQDGETGWFFLQRPDGKISIKAPLHVIRDLMDKLENDGVIQWW